jgi:hypothetical protein
VDQVQQDLPTGVEEDDNGQHNQKEYMNDWSYDQHYANDGLGGENEEHNEVQEDEHHSERTQMVWKVNVFCIQILQFISTTNI